jgi:acetyltransferase-like isoleucine patch superfamily enzyme
MRKFCRLVWKVARRLSSAGFVWRRFWLWAQGIEFGRNLLVEPGVRIDNAGQVEIGNDVWLGRGVYVNVWPNARLKIEDNTYVGRGTVILVHGSVRIGAHGMIAPYGYITDVNHGMARGRPMRGQPLTSSPIDIGPDVWFGAGCSVLPGVHIGQGCIVGARAVVARDLPDYVVAVGVPARVIKVRPPPEGTGEVGA